MYIMVGSKLFGNLGGGYEVPLSNMIISRPLAIPKEPALLSGCALLFHYNGCDYDNDTIILVPIQSNA